MPDLMNIKPDILRKQLQNHMNSMETFEEKMAFALQLHSLRKTDPTGEINILPGVEDAIMDVEQSLFYRRNSDGSVDEDYAKLALREFNKNLIAMQVRSSRMLEKDPDALSLDEYYRMTDLYEIYEEFRESMIAKDEIKKERTDDYTEQINALSNDDLDAYRYYYINRDKAMERFLLKDTGNIDRDARRVEARKVYALITEELLPEKTEALEKSTETPPLSEEERTNKILDGLLSYSERLTDITNNASDMLEDYNRLKASKGNNSGEFIRLGEALEAVSKLTDRLPADEIEDTLDKLQKASAAYNEWIDSSRFRGVFRPGKERRSLSGRLSSFAEEGMVSLHAVYPEGLERQFMSVSEQGERAFRHLENLDDGKKSRQPAPAETDTVSRDAERSRKTSISEMRKDDDLKKGLDPIVKQEILEKHREITEKRRGSEPKPAPDPRRI